MQDNQLYPLQIEPRLVQTVWGGEQLAGWLNLAEPRPERLGEIWLVYDENLIVNGSLAGLSLREAAQRHGAALVGARTVERYGNDFPLLAKFIDAGDKLSIQVHPDDSYAHTREAQTGFHGKTEAWYILRAAAGADVVHGLARTTSRAEFAAAVADGSLSHLLRSVAVQPGDTIFVPAGTVHAINAGILLFEIQQKSDLTYRVYDYNRPDHRTGQPRELHLDKALDVIDYSLPPPAPYPSTSLGDNCTLLVRCPSFTLERWDLGGEQRLATDAGSCEILAVVEGSARLRWEAQEMLLGTGAAVVLPASLGRYSLAPQEGTGCQILRCYLPDPQEAATSDA